MSILVGFDLVDCARCADWLKLSDKALMKIFSSAEIAYCRKDPAQSASRFAVRFAAREALYKALNTLQHDRSMPFLLFCRSVEVVKSATNRPSIKLDAAIMATFYAVEKIADLSLSLSHTATTTGAVVIITLKSTTLNSVFNN